MNINELLGNDKIAHRIELGIQEHCDSRRGLDEALDLAVSGEAYSDQEKRNWLIWMSYTDGSAMHIEGLLEGWKFIPYDRDEVVSYTRNRAEELCLVKAAGLGSVSYLAHL